MFSVLRRLTLSDAAGRHAKLHDLAVDLAAGDYPPVTELSYHLAGRGRLALPWSAVDLAEWRGRGRLRVAALADAAPAAPEALERKVLLGRDVMDALVLDTEARQALRANDLWLEQRGDHLLLDAADVSPWAVLRRFGRGVLGRGADRNLVDWRRIEFLRGDPAAAGAGHDYHRRVARLPPSEIAHLADALPYPHAAELLTLLPDPLAADVLEAMTLHRQVQVFEELAEGQGDRLLALLAPDAAADLLAQLDPPAVRRRLEHLPSARRERVLALLRYPDDTAGGIMTNDLVVAPAALTVGEARRVLADQLRSPDFVYYVFVVDAPETRRLRGVLTLRDLFVAEDTAPLEALMHSQPFALDPLTPADVAARRLADTEFAALPVVDRDGRLVGAVTIDAALARIAPPGWRDQAPKVFS